MEVSLAEQEELFVLISKAVVHYRELPESFMTRGHIETRIHSLDEYWQRFKTQHFELIKMAGIKKEMYPYFKNDMFYLADDTYNRTKGIMVDELEKIDSSNTKMVWKELAMCNEETFIMIKSFGANVKALTDSLKTRGFIQTRISILDEYWQKFSTTHFEILKLATASDRQDHIYFKQNIFLQCEEEYIAIKGSLVDMLEKLSNPVNIHQDPGNINQGAENAGFKQEQLINKPMFSEENGDWKILKDVCGTLVQDTPTFENIQKLVEQASCVLEYLKPAVKDEDNAEKSFRKTLKIDINRSEVDTLLNTIINQKKIQKPTSESIKNLIDVTLECLRLLEDGLDISNWDTILIHILCNKLNNKLRWRWSTEVGKLPKEELPTLKNFTDFLNTQYMSLKRDPQCYDESDESDSAQATFETYHSDFVKIGNRTTADKNASNVRKPFCYECLTFGHEGHECQYHE